MKKNIYKIPTLESVDYSNRVQPLLLKRGILNQDPKQKLISRKYEISFETDFFKQHWNSFLKSYEPCFIKQNLHELDWIYIEQGIQNAYSTQYHNKVLRLVREKPNFSQFQKPHFEQITRQRQKLLTFYSLIETNLAEQQTIELIYIGYCMCKKYQQIKQNLKLLQSQYYHEWIKNTAQSYANQLRQQNNKIISLQNESVNSAALAKFIAIYCQTVLLIIQEYFDNPNADEEDKLV